MNESDAIQDALSRRGLSLGATQQITPASPAAPQMPQPTDTAMAQAAMPQQGVGQQPMQAEAPESDMTIALTALADVVKAEEKLKKDVLQMKMMGAV